MTDPAQVTQRPVRLVRGGAESTGTLRWWQSGPRDFQVALDRPTGTVHGRGPDLFDALVDVRRQLEVDGWLLALQGARRDTFPSGMTREMAGGARVYVLRVGEQARDTVGTFDDAPAELLGTVEEQQRHFDTVRSTR